MSVVTIWYPDIDTEKEAEEKLEKMRREMREFRSRSHPETRTQDLWNRYYNLQANIMWLEERLEWLQKHRGTAQQKKPLMKTIRKRKTDDDE